MPSLSFSKGGYWYIIKYPLLLPVIPPILVQFWSFLLVYIIIHYHTLVCVCVALISLQNCSAFLVVGDSAMVCHEHLHLLVVHPQVSSLLHRLRGNQVKTLDISFHCSFGLIWHMNIIEYKDIQLHILWIKLVLQYICVRSSVQSTILAEFLALFHGPIRGSRGSQRANQSSPCCANPGAHARDGVGRWCGQGRDYAGTMKPMVERG